MMREKYRDIAEIFEFHRVVRAYRNIVCSYRRVRPQKIKISYCLKENLFICTYMIVEVFENFSSGNIRVGKSAVSIRIHIYSNGGLVNCEISILRQRMIIFLSCTRVRTGYACIINTVRDAR